MTYTPYDQSLDPAPAYGYGYAADALPAEPPARRRRSRRPLLVGATAAGVLALGGGGYAVAAYLSGGGAQPQEVLPADTVAFVTIDLDPAMGQKTAVASLMEKFPALGEGTDDIRQRAVDQLLELSDTDLDYATDLEPWLGDRMAAALVPDAASEGGMTGVLVLAVDDQQAMSDTLRLLGDDVDFGSAVRDDFLFLAADQATADRIAAEESRLSEDDEYVADRAALDGDQIAVAWADMSALQQLAAQALDGDAPLGLDASLGLVGDLTGRVVYGLHAEDDALELVGMDFTVSDTGPGPRPTEPARLVQQLPADTVAAVSASGAGDVMADQWAALAETGMLDGFEEMFPNLDMPEDVRTVFGSEFLVALRGHDIENPRFGIRAVTDDAQRGSDIVRGLVYAFDLGIPTVPGVVDDGYVLGTDVITARALAGEDPGLGSSAAFRAAVPGAENATLVGYADLATILEQMPAGDGFRPEDYEAVQSLGFTSTPTDQGSRAVLRITTR